MPEGPTPMLSIVVTVVSDTVDPPSPRHLEGCLQALARQTDAGQPEIIVTHAGRPEQFDAVARRFPAVRFLAAPDVRTGAAASREHHDRLRTLGILAARGDIVALLEDHGRPGPQWGRRLQEAHREAHAAVGGAIENGVDRPLNWAVYFSDFARYQNPLPAGPSACLSDANVSYKRAALERIPHAWRPGFQEPRVNGALLDAGDRLWLDPAAIVYQHRLDLRLRGVLAERYVWGRSYAAARLAGAGGIERLRRAALTPFLPPVLTARIAGKVLRTPCNRRPFVRSFPALVLCTTAWSLGELAGYLTGRPG